jgi:hypothetical protein
METTMDGILHIYVLKVRSTRKATGGWKYSFRVFGVWGKSGATREFTQTVAKHYHMRQSKADSTIKVDDYPTEFSVRVQNLVEHHPELFPNAVFHGEML